MQFYLSHAIRGLAGEAATNTEQAKNCEIAVDIGKQITDALPTIELYIPGDQTEQFVGIAYKDGYLNIEQILAIDCKIIDNSEGVLFYIPKGDELQGGRLVEFNHAVREKKPTYIFADIQQAVVYLTKYIMGV